MNEKPPYRIPSMVEVRAVPLNGLKVASTFSGCGGSCLGFRWAGFEHVYASEFIPAARDTYRANFPDVFLDDRDIREVTPEDLMIEAGVGVGELDVLEGSPPCASFSTAGKRSKAWGEVKAYSDTRQRTDDLFFEFVRLLRGVRPRAFVAENVSGLVKGVARGYFVEIMRELRASGYVVECRVLDAQWLGVPQARQRTIFVGFRADLAIAPTFPAPLPYRYSIRDAIGQLGRARAGHPGMVGTKTAWGPDDVAPTIMAGGIGGGNTSQMKIVRTESARLRQARGSWGGDSELSMEAPAPTIGAEESIGGTRRETLVVDGDGPSISRYAIGEEWNRLRPGQSSDRYFNLVRPDPDAPLGTVTQLGGSNAGVASVTHPSEPRKFTIAELRRLCAFPDDFALTGTYAQQWERLGRAVPPRMMFAVASVVRDQLLRAKGILREGDPGRPSPVADL